MNNKSRAALRNFYMASASFAIMAIIAISPAEARYNSTSVEVDYSQVPVANAPAGWMAAPMWATTQSIDKPRTPPRPGYSNVEMTSAPTDRYQRGAPIQINPEVLERQRAMADNDIKVEAIAAPKLTPPAFAAVPKLTPPPIMTAKLDAAPAPAAAVPNPAPAPVKVAATRSFPPLKLSPPPSKNALAQNTVKPAEIVAPAAAPKTVLADNTPEIKPTSGPTISAVAQQPVGEPAMAPRKNNAELNQMLAASIPAPKAETPVAAPNSAPEDLKLADAKPEVAASATPPLRATPAEQKTADAKPDVKVSATPAATTSVTEKSDAEITQMLRAQMQPSAPKTVAAIDTKPAAQPDLKIAAAKPVENKPVESNPAETKRTETEPAETKPATLAKTDDQTPQPKIPTKVAVVKDQGDPAITQMLRAQMHASVTPPKTAIMPPQEKIVVAKAEQPKLAPADLASLPVRAPSKEDAKRENETVADAKPALPQPATSLPPEPQTKITLAKADIDKNSVVKTDTNSAAKMASVKAVAGPTLSPAAALPDLPPVPKTQINAVQDNAGKATSAQVAEAAPAKDITLPPIAPPKAIETTKVVTLPTVHEAGLSQEEDTTPAMMAQAEVAQASKAQPAAVKTAIPNAPAANNEKTGMQIAGKSSLIFAANSMDVEPERSVNVDQLAEQIADDPRKRLEIKSYASKTNNSTSEARRIALQRGLAVRETLIAKGVPANKIDVRALGYVEDAVNPPDRVDLQAM